MSRIMAPLEPELAKWLYDMPLQHRAALAALIHAIEKVSGLHINVDVRPEVKGLLVIEDTRDWHAVGGAAEIRASAFAGRAPGTHAGEGGKRDMYKQRPRPRGLSFEPRVIEEATEDGETRLVLRTVYIDPVWGIINASTDDVVSPFGSNLAELRAMSTEMAKALEKPILKPPFTFHPPPLPLRRSIEDKRFGRLAKEKQVWISYSWSPCWSRHGERRNHADDIDADRDGWCGVFMVGQPQVARS
jgi:hypothetical protein